MSGKTNQTHQTNQIMADFLIKRKPNVEVRGESLYIFSGKLFKNKATFQQMSNRVEGNKNHGLGIEVIGDTETELYYGHRGAFFNTSSIVYFFPKHEITICICNTYNGTTSRLQTDILMKLIM